MYLFPTRVKSHLLLRGNKNSVANVSLGVTGDIALAYAQGVTYTGTGEGESLRVSPRNHYRYMHARAGVLCDRCSCPYSGEYGSTIYVRLSGIVRNLIQKSTGMDTLK